LADVNDLQRSTTTKLNSRATAGSHLLVGLDGCHCLRSWGDKLHAGTEGLGRGLVTGLQSEVTGHLNTEPIGLQVLLAQSSPARSPGVPCHQPLSDYLSLPNLASLLTDHSEGPWLELELLPTETEPLEGGVSTGSPGRPHLHRQRGRSLCPELACSALYWLSALVAT